MKRWILCALVAPLAACSQGGGSGTAETPNFGAVNCPAKPAMNGMTTKSFDGGFVTSSRDPFETNGKVQLSGENVSFSGMTTQSTVGGKRFAAGTQFTVSLRETCENPGPIARAVATADDSNDEATPAGVRSYDWTTPGAITLAKLTEAVEADPCIAGLTEAGVAEINSLPTDPLVGEQAHLAMLEAGSAYDHLVPSITIKPVVIAVIDTGVDVVHQDMKDVLWKNPGEIPGNGIDDDKNGYKDDYNGYNFEDKKPSPAAGAKWGGYHHGTHVAGLAGAQGGNSLGGTGVMGTGVRIMGLNVFGSTSGARVSDVANAIRYAADNGADIVNLSLGGSGRNTTYESAINYAIKKGVTILAASG
ncbi:MAG: S8 family serine peptidase, partial [Bdellovibrionota bacterium]